MSSGPLGGSDGAPAVSEDAIWLLATALSSAGTPLEVARVVADHAAPAAGATFSNMALLDAGAGRILAVHRPGLPEDVVGRWSEFDLDVATPLGDAMRTGTPVLLPSMDEIGRRYPHMVADTVAASLGATASLGLRRPDGSTVGAVGFAWPDAQTFPPPLLRRLELIAQMTAQALDRALLSAAQRERNERLALLQRLTERLAATTTAGEVARVALTEAGPMIGAAIANITSYADGWIEHVADTDMPEVIGRVTRRPLSDRVPSTDAIRTGAPVIHATHADREAAYRGASWLPELAGFGPVVALPALVHNRPVGTVALVFPAGRRLAEDDLGFLRAFAAQCAQALERARLLDVERARARQEHHVAEILQRSLLPRLPDLEVLEVAAAYAPGASDAEVGGDWYEVFDLGAGRVGLVIGDVMGHDLAAAAVMGQLRGALRSYARLELPPSDVLSLLDRLVDDYDEFALVTCLYAVYDAADRSLTVANAGHLLPLAVVGGRGPAVPLDVPPGPPLGLGLADQRDYRVPLAPGTLLAFFTDGLVEARGLDIDHGVARLAALLAPGAGPDGPLQGLAEGLLAGMAGHHDHGDDTAVLLVRVPVAAPAPGPERLTLEVAPTPAGVRVARSELRAALGGWGVDDDAVDAVALVASELVTNAVVHGRAPIRLVLRAGSDRVYVEVADASRIRPRPARAAPGDERGRGLHLVAGLAHRWGVRPGIDGKTVWAELAR